MGKKARRSSKTTLPGGSKAAAGPAPSSANLVAWTERDRRYWPAVAAVCAVAATLRLLWLDHAIFQHDEAIYSIFSHNFHEYNFDPVYHGPTLYHIIKLFFLIAGAFVKLGDNDWSARFVSVVMGGITLWMVLGPARRWLGARGALWAAALLALSPSMVTYQRRILFDAWVVVLTLGSILCFQNALMSRVGSWARRNAWVGLVALLTAFLATKANAFFVIAMIGSFWVMTWLRGRGPRDLILRLPAQLPLILFLVVSIAAVLALRDENKKQNELMLAVVSVAASALLWEWLRRTGPEPRGARRSPDAESVPDTEPAAPPAGQWVVRPRFVIYTVVLGLAGAGVCYWLGASFVKFALVYFGLVASLTLFQWRRQLDWMTIGLCVLVAALVFGFFFGHVAPRYWAGGTLLKPPHKVLPNFFSDVGNAIPKMLAYWGGQQKEPRLPGRHDFYLPMLIAYELPILLAAIFGIIRASARRTRFADLMLWWLFTSYALYSLANEKVPWLIVHLVTPLALLGGWWLGQLRFERPLARWVFAAACVLSAVYLVRNVSATNYERAIDHREPMFYAFTTESFRDTYYHAIGVAKEQKRNGDIWIYNAWPPSWYMRHADVDFPGAAVHYPENYPSTQNPMKLVVCRESDWGQHRSKFEGWNTWKWDPQRGVVADGRGENPYILNWPRISWTSLRPDKWLRWWVTREARLPEGVADPILGEGDPFLTEWSHIPVMVATPP